MYAELGNAAPALFVDVEGALAGVVEAAAVSAGVPQVSTGVVGHGPPKSHLSPFVRPFQASVRPSVKSSHSFVTLAMISDGKAASTEVILPSSMSSTMLTTSVTAASPTWMTSDGRRVRMFRTSPNTSTASCGRFVMIDGTWPSSIWSTNNLASSTSDSRVLMMLQGISVMYCAMLPLLELRRPRTALLVMVSVEGA